MTTDLEENHPDRGTREGVKRWVTAGVLLVVSILPCPECGTPLALHIWPLLPLFAFIRAARRRRADDGQTGIDGSID